MALYKTGGGGGETEFDFFDAVFAQSSGSTYTFNQNLKSCYVCAAKSSAASTTGLYTGGGTVTTKFTSTYTIIQEITNISSGDKYKASALTISTNPRTIMFFIGQTV